MRQRNYIFATGLLVLVTVMSSAQQDVLAHDPIMLAEEGILSQIIGNTATGVGKKHKWTEYYHPDGTIRGRTDDGTNDGPYQGKWTVSGSKMCFVYVVSGDVGCWTIYVKGNEITYSKKGKYNTTGTLLKGNPKNL